MPGETPRENNDSINSENIFDEFTDSQDIKKELEKTEKNNEKDVYYYLKKISGFLLAINIFLFLTLIGCFGYIYVQNNDQRTEYGFLAPICSIFLGNSDIYNDTCYGVTSSLNEYNNKLQTLSANQSEQALPLLGDKFSLENYNLSKKVNFLLDKGRTRLKPLEILNEFDGMKDIFSATDKSEISCYDITIASDIISMSCDSFSSDWNTDILSVENTLLKTVDGGGTSISKASSFINFFETYSSSPFSIVEKPEFYTSESFQSGPYTRKTTFQFSMRYDGIESLEIN